jgi:hypothetical protein
MMKKWKNNYVCIMGNGTKVCCALCKLKKIMNLLLKLIIYIFLIRKMLKKCVFCYTKKDKE